MTICETIIVFTLLFILYSIQGVKQEVKEVYNIMVNIESTLRSIEKNTMEK